jgi:hypothetical protein
VGNLVVVDVVAKYDVKVMYPLLLQVYLHLNFMKTTIEPTTLEDDCFFE